MPGVNLTSVQVVGTTICLVHKGKQIGLTRPVVLPKPYFSGSTLSEATLTDQPTKSFLAVRAELGWERNLVKK